MPDQTSPSHAGQAGSSASATAPGASPSRDRWRLLRNATFAGLAVSMAAHAVFLLVALYINFFGPVGDGEGVAAPVEFAVVSQAELAQLSGDLPQPSTPIVPETPPVDVPESTLSETLDADAIATETLAITPEDLGIGAGDIGEGADLGGAGDGGGASFFGVEAKGSRFAYIVDTSGSMSIGGKIETLRDELATSVNALTDNAEFCIFLYSTAARPLGDRGDWIQAGSRGKAWARRLIAQIPAEGGTNPLPGFELAHQLRPRPDAIYFMTDGEFHPDTIDAILQTHAKLDIPVHCITFVNDAAEPYMRRLAQSTGGSYTHIAGTANLPNQLPRRVP